MNLNHRVRRNRLPWLRRRRGQALVETALAAPFLVMLLLGGAQVGSISYDQVSLDTAAREGARAGAALPTTAVYSVANGSQWYNATDTSTYTYRCQAADFGTATNSPNNPICHGVLNSTGFLTQGTFTTSPCGTNQACVTITVVPPANLASVRTSPFRPRLVSAAQPLSDAGNNNPCTSGQAEVDGTVIGIPSGMTATLTDTSNDQQNPTVSSGSPTYQYCVTANGNVKTQVITAQVGPAVCGGYTGSVSLTANPNQTYTGENINLVYEGDCPTTTTSSSTSTTTTTGTTTTTTATSTATSSAVTGPPTGCAANPAVADSYYFKVSVTYPAPIFVPFINNLFQTSSGVRMITATVTYPIDPCDMTGNGTS